ncbi:uncharacterized protein K460DRAFT_349865 [Cucurbitaria berberidis CBS 394.84]|uniref:Uncharacterized protein n=1 Tax=Cucurbitaria berberidis CBS 394.84 TaxID=1168544 RepID=A0A9P4GNG3_9PLEO|nr:uncharacterized protein K460DRAFT_349865 [Cucurbitaria berberidis CBS 394.84]KAF1849703.1 hypothetical protein K460DRAFT_349865 [Cucurbitaria berberidis CBS 394.84]
MQRRQIKKLASKAKGTKLTNFDALLHDIRSKLGPDWEFYLEFLDGAIRATARGQDVSAWFEQVEQLVEGREDVAFSHQGVLFLLAEMGVKVRSEAPSTNSMPPPPLPAPLVPLPLLPSEIQPAQHTADYRSKLPLDFNRSTRPPMPSSATSSSQPRMSNIAFMGSRQAVNAKPSALNNGVDPIFFTDPAFKRDVQDFFGISTQRSGTRDHTTRHYNQNELVLPYNAKEDDLNVWKKRVEAGYEVKDKDAEGASKRGERVALFEQTQQIELSD